MAELTVQPGGSARADRTTTDRTTRGSHAGAPPLTSEEVKAKAREFGAHLVGIASCAELEANPPDPEVRQVPSRIMPEAKSCIVMARRTPWGTFLSDNLDCISTTNQAVMRSLEKVAYKLSDWLDRQGHYSYQLASEETDPDLKRGSYGWLSLRHLAVWAGLGTMGLEWNLLTPEFGPRVYLSAVLTTAELVPDKRLTEQVCIGPSCGRCLLSCPTDAIGHWSLNKRNCAQAAQVHGVASIVYGPIQDLVHPRDPERRAQVMYEPRTEAKYLSMVRLKQSFAACPRCVEVCPVGEDYKRFLADAHREIPEKTPTKLITLNEIRGYERRGERAPDARPLDRRWLGEEGYKPRKAAAPANGGTATAEANV